MSVFEILTLIANFGVLVLVVLQRRLPFTTKQEGRIRDIARADLNAIDLDRRRRAAEDVSAAATSLRRGFPADE